MGKNHLSKKANTTKHGLTCSDLLRCRIDKCYYWDVCPLQLYLEDYWYGYSCPVEVERFKESFNAYTNSLNYLSDLIDGDKLNSLIHNLAISEVCALRADNALAITADLPQNRREPHSEIPSNVLWRYRSELYIKRNKLFKKVRELKSAAALLG